MAISYVGGKVAGTAGQGGGSITLTSGWSGGSGGNPLEGDLVVVTVCIGTAARTPSALVSGYSQLTQQNANGTTYDTSLGVSYKFMGSTPDTTVTIPASGNNADGIAYSIRVYRGVDTTTPMDTTATYATGSGTDNLPNPLTITPVTAGAWILFCGGGASGTGTTAFTASYTTDFHQANGPDTNDGTVGVGHYTSWASGAYDGAKFGGGSVNAANSWSCVTVALRPIVAVTLSGAGTSAGTSTPSGVGAQSAAGEGTTAGTSTASATGVPTLGAVGSADGTSTATAVSASTVAGVGTAAGTSTPTGVGAETIAGVGTSAGTSTPTGVGAATAAGAGSEAGTSTASGVGAATAAGVGSSDGLAAVSGVGSASGGGVLTGFLQLEDGTGNITNEALIDPILDTDGIALRDVDGFKIYDADNTAAAGYFILEGGAVIAEPGDVYAWSAASGVGAALIDPGVGTASGVATVSGVGAVLSGTLDAVGTAAGTSTASGVGSANDVTVTPPTTGGRGGGGGGRKKDREYTGSAKLSNPVTDAEIRAAYDTVMGITPAPIAQPTQKPAQRQVTTKQARLAAADEQAAADALARQEQDEEDALIALLLVA